MSTTVQKALGIYGIMNNRWAVARGTMDPNGQSCESMQSLKDALVETDVAGMVSKLDVYFQQSDPEKNTASSEELTHLRNVMKQFISQLQNGGHKRDDCQKNMEMTINHCFFLKLQDILNSFKISDKEKEDLVARAKHAFTALEKTNKIKFESVEEKVTYFEKLMTVEDEDLAEELYKGWHKNQHELKKREKKMNSFHSLSNSQLQEIEDQVRLSQEENKKFRATIGQTNDRISDLLKQMGDVSKQSEFLQKQIDIVDETVTEMEKCKEHTNNECLRLEGDLNNKQASLVELLKKIDQDLETNLDKYQDYLERSKCFNEAVEEIATCYTSFEEQENLILAKYNLSKPEIIFELDPAVVSNRKNMELTDQVQKLSKEKRKISFQMEDVKTENEALALDIEDLFELNSKLTNENLYLQLQLEETSLKSNFLEASKDGEVKKQSEEELHKAQRRTHEDIRNHHKIIIEENAQLKEKCETLQKQNESLRGMNKKVQDVYNENQELLEETNGLHDEVDELEEKVKKREEELERSKKERKEMAEKFRNLTNENDELKENFSKLKKTRQPRLLHVQTKNIDLLKLSNSDQNIPEDDNKVLELALIEERDRTALLESSIKKLQIVNSTLLSCCRKIGLSNLKLGVSYKVEMHSETGEQVMTYTGVSLTEKEGKSLKCSTQRSSLDEEYRIDSANDEESLTDELTRLLQESYERCDRMKTKQRQLKDEIIHIGSQINMLHQSENSLVLNSQSDKLFAENNSMIHTKDFEVLISFLTDLGLQKLDDGVQYSVHFQAITNTESQKRATETYQHSCLAMNLDPIKRIVQNLVDNHSLVNRVGTHTFANRDDVSLEASVENVLVQFKSVEEKMPFKPTFDKEKCDLERLLRISRRERDELNSELKKLKKELQQIKETRITFSKERASGETILSESECSDDESNSSRNDECKDHKEKLSTLEEAYKLSEANCVFLEKKFREVETQMKHIELTTDEYRNDSFDKSEQIECLEQELNEASKKLNQSQRTIGELKKDIEYLERDCEYYKQKLQFQDQAQSADAGISVSKESAVVLSNFMALKSDYNNAVTEKKRALAECENLKGQIKYLEIEKLHLDEQLHGFERERIHSDINASDELMPLKSHIIIDRERSSSFTEREVKEHGLAKKYKHVEKENSDLRKELKELTGLKAKLKQHLDLQSIETEALRTTNQDLQTKIFDLEKRISSSKQTNSTKKRKESIALKDFESQIALVEKQNKTLEEKDSLYTACETIKEEAIFLAHENQEIRESNDVLMKRNQSLRKKSLAAVNSKRQIELLMEKMSTLENENEILKVESMKIKAKETRKTDFVRKVSQQCDLPLEATSIRTRSCITLAKGTQTGPTLFAESAKSREFLKRLDSSESEDEKDVDVEELQFMIEDLTKRNSELKAKIYGFDNKLEAVEEENQRLETINERLLSWNEELKKQKEETEKSLQEVSAEEYTNSGDISDKSLGMNLFFEKDILGEYEKAELEETNKGLQYENRMLKNNIQDYQEIIDSLKSEMKTAEGTVENLKRKIEKLSEEHEQIKIDEYLELQEQNKENLSANNAVHIACNNDVILTITPPREDEIDALKETINELRQNLEQMSLEKVEHRATIGHLERQLLQMINRSGESRASHPMKESEKNEVVDELFDVKFLLQSNTANDNDLEMSDGNLSEFEFETGLKDGEFSFEMEEFFKNYNPPLESKQSDCSSVSENDLDDDENENLTVYEAKSENATRISGVQTFRAKEHMEKTLEVFQQQLSDHKERNRELCEEIAVLKGKVEEIGKKEGDARKSLFLIQNEHRNCSTTFETKAREIQELKDRVAVLKKSEEDARKEIEDLNQTVNKVTLQASEEKQKKENYENELMKVTEEFEELKEVNHDQGILLKSLEEYNKDLQEKLQGTEEKRLKAKEKFDDASNQQNELEKDINKKEEHIKNLESSLHLMVSQLTNKNDDIEKLNATSNQLEHEIEDKIQSIKNLESSLDQIVLQVTDKNNEVNKLNEMCNRFKNENNEMEDLIKEQEKMLIKERDVSASLKHDCDVTSRSLSEKKEAEIELRKQLTEKEKEMTKEKTKATDSSFVIERGTSEDWKQATETSLEDGDITLPAIYISKQSGYNECENCMKRSFSCPAGSSSANLSISSLTREKHTSLSDISDVESTTDDNDDYVHRLKMKLKLAREKVREKNKVIRNQNEDIDNFLHDIRLKEEQIKSLKIKINENKVKEENLESGKEERSQSGDVLGMETPSFAEETRTSEFQNRSSNDTFINELFTFAEDCFNEMQRLQVHMKELELQSEDPAFTGKLQRRLEEAHQCISLLKDKLKKCIDLKLISYSESVDAMANTNGDSIDNSLSGVTVTPEMVKNNTVGKTVNEIRSDNELLKQRNKELQEKLEDIDKQFLQESMLKETQYHENMIQMHEIERLENVVKRLQSELKEQKIKLGDENSQVHLDKENSFNAQNKEYEELRTTIKNLNEKQNASESQAKKDWLIIEKQNAQVHDLHQDLTLQEKETSQLKQYHERNETKLAEKEKEINDLKSEIVKVKSNVNEKEEGIDNLHHMVSDLEKSLNNSQRHVDGILNESAESRDREQEKNFLINEQESIIKCLKNELNKLQQASYSRKESRPSISELENISLLNLKTLIDGLSSNQHSLREDATKLFSIFKEELTDYRQNMNTLITGAYYLHNMRTPNSLNRPTTETTVLDNKESEANLNLTNGDLAHEVKKDNDSEPPIISKLPAEVKAKIEKQENLVKTLATQLKQAQEVIEAKETLHKMQIDTIVQSLAKRTNVLPRASGKTLRPSIELSKASSRMGPSEFLKTCLEQIEQNEQESKSTSNRCVP